MGLRSSIVRHRNSWLRIASIVLGVLIPLPGYFLAAFIWPAGGHDVDSTNEAVVFVTVVYGLSIGMWALFANWVLPRHREEIQKNQV